MNKDTTALQAFMHANPSWEHEAHAENDYATFKCWPGKGSLDADLDVYTFSAMSVNGLSDAIAKVNKQIALAKDMKLSHGGLGL